jgi:hypothetical protein
MLAVAVGAALGAGCGKTGGSTGAIDNQPVDAADDGVAFATCLQAHANDGVAPYAPGVTATSSGGTFQATLVSNQPGYPVDGGAPAATGPEVRGVNTWLVAIADGTGAPVDGLTVGASPYMPDHLHGSTVAPQTTAVGSGHYVVSPLYLYMTGYWEVTLTLQPPAVDGGAVPRSETVVFKTCIP